MVAFPKRINPYFALLVVVILAYWQVSFLVSALKWDLIDVVFPFRFYFSECIQSGYFPFWNPYLQTGTPFSADLQAPVFYPELFLTGIFTGYSILTMHFLFVLYTFIAGAGMYKLSVYFNGDRTASFIAALAYSLNGFLVGHGQHFFLLVGVAWCPFVVQSYLQLLRDRRTIDVLKTGIFVFLMITGAYQALSFALFYLLMLVFFYFLIKDLKGRNIKRILELMQLNLMLLLVVVLFALPLIVSTVDILDSVDRLEKGIVLEETLSQGMSLKSLISFVLPSATLNYPEFFGGVDTSMRNHYFGLIPLVLLAGALLKKQTTLEYLLLVFGLIILASCFRALPVREFMFAHVPFMNLFKYAAYIRVFGLFAFILVAANYLAYFRANIEKEKKKVIFIVLLLLGFILFLIVYSAGKLTPEEQEAIFGFLIFKGLPDAMSFHQHIVVQGIFQFIVAAAFLALVLFSQKIKRYDILVVGLVAVELIVALQFNINITVTDKEHNPLRMAKDLALYPEKFPVPVDDKIIYNDDLHVLSSPFWRNTYVFSKQVSFDSFSSFRLKSYDLLDRNETLRKAVLNNHLFYFSDKIRPLRHYDERSLEGLSATKDLFLNDDDLLKLSSVSIATDSADTFEIKEFSPNKVVVETDSRYDQFFTMLQTNFKGWNAYVDNVETPLYTSNFNYRTILLPKGRHTVLYQYKNTKILVLYAVSNVLFILALAFLLGYGLKKANNKRQVFVGIPAAFLLVTAVFLVIRLSYKDKNQKVVDTYNARWSEKSTVYHVSETFDHEPSGSKQLTANDAYFTLAKVKNENGALKQGTLVLRAKVLSDEYVDALIVSDVEGDGKEEHWRASKISKQMEKTSRWNEVIYFRNFYDLKSGDELNLYLWNNNKNSFCLDDVKVDFYPF